MDEKGIRLIRRSFAQVAALASPAAILFYGRLFRIDPALRGLFTSADMRVQGARFIAALGYAVATLDRPERLLPIARDVALRLGLRPEHHRPVGEALEWMLEECLAEDFSPELRAAWNKAYRELTATMAAQERPAWVV
ncbi:hemin receptor [Roseococcus sp. SYP-B2431]|uniref:globin domain-containing protein n=1 Tax=Roseococcus sp. SYP-B2431 TaxID=2496640 RepID=UPI00103AE8A5|nr:globin domain-containing protein [Roseococcus sp. SYP-B2431]TCI00018.1 hemin receptor [Roseococcus sp. SYP-B2431]